MVEQKQTKISSRTPPPLPNEATSIAEPRKVSTARACLTPSTGGTAATSAHLRRCRLDVGWSFRQRRRWHRSGAALRRPRAGPGAKLPAQHEDRGPAKMKVKLPEDIAINTEVDLCTGWRVVYSLRSAPRRSACQGLGRRSRRSRRRRARITSALIPKPCKEGSTSSRTSSNRHE